MKLTELFPGCHRSLRAALLLAVLAVLTPLGAFAQDAKPNILVIWGDDIGTPQISAYT
jgi:arylsulfatase